MKRLNILFGVLIITFVIISISCEEESNDSIKPTIELIFPQSCDTVHTESEFFVQCLLMDNIELGSYSVEFHNNFNQHGHTTESAECELDAEKDPVSPFVYQKSFPIEPGLKEYTTNLGVTIPNNIDPGDYHINISCIDKSGWQTFRIVSIKVLNK